MNDETKTLTEEEFAVLTEDQQAEARRHTVDRWEGAHGALRQRGAGPERAVGVDAGRERRHCEHVGERECCSGDSEFGEWEC